MALTQERKNEIIKEYARHEGDTGSAEVQIAVLTADINELNAHMAAHKHDFSLTTWFDEEDRSPS